MQIKVSLSEFEEKAVYLSRTERYGESAAAGITPGFELGSLIEEFSDAKIDELEKIVIHLKETSDTVRAPINWRIKLDTNKKLEDLAARVNASKSDVIRGIIHMRARDLKGNDENMFFSTAAWVMNCGAVIPVNLIVEEIIRVRSDIFVLSSYNRTALGRGDLKTVLAEMGYGVFESRYYPGKKGFLVVYNSRRFRLIAEIPGAKTAFLPLAFRDNNCGRDIVFVCVKVPYNDDVEDVLRKLNKLVDDIRQEKKYQTAEIVMTGDFRAIPSWIEKLGVWSGSLSLCPTRNDEWSFVYENNWKNKLDHIFISNGLECVDKAEYKWDFLGDDHYNGQTAAQHINIPGLPNHAVICSQIKYK